MARRDEQGAEQLFEEATKVDDSFVLVHQLLGGRYMFRGQWDQAIAHYERVVVHTPKDAAALNNLAYLIAEQRHKPEEALPLAKRAYELDPQNPAIADTVGWIHHLLGNDAEAERFLRSAVARFPNNPDIQVHVAVVYAALGKNLAAAEALERALKLHPALESRTDVTELRARLGTR
jgi:Tfp pilus assembly protein PilF